MKSLINWFRNRRRKKPDVKGLPKDYGKVAFFLEDNENGMIVIAVGYSNGVPKAVYSGMLDENVLVFTFRETAEEWGRILNASVHELVMEDGKITEVDT